MKLINKQNNDKIHQVNIKNTDIPKMSQGYCGFVKRMCKENV